MICFGGLVFTMSDCIVFMGSKLNTTKMVHALAGVVVFAAWAPGAQLGIQTLHRQVPAQMRNPSTSHVLPGNPGA